MMLAAERGLSVAKPWGDSGRYDVAVEHEGKFMRVQVKCTMARCGKGYVCTFIRSGLAPYTAEELDFFAIYVIPVDVWYIIPAEVATLHKHNTCCRRGSRGINTRATLMPGIFCAGRGGKRPGQSKDSR